MIVANVGGHHFFVYPKGGPPKIAKKTGEIGKREKKSGKRGQKSVKKRKNREEKAKTEKVLSAYMQCPS